MRPSDLGTIDPCGELRELLDRPSPWSGTEQAEELRRRANALAAEWQSAIRDDPLGRAVVHGDVHRENAVVTERGLVLVDLEGAAVGPASWDFAPLRVGVRRYGVPLADYRAFVAGYEDEPGAWEGFPYLASVYELVSVAWAMRCSALSPRMVQEASVRVAGVLGRGDVTWRLS